MRNFVKDHSQADQRNKPLLLVSLIVLFWAIFNTQTDAAETSNRGFKVEVIGQGKAILLIPGLMSDASIWQATAVDLSQKHQVHLISICGFGSTKGKPAASLSDIKQQLLTYIEQEKLHKPTIIGHSLGGFMAFWLASSKPNTIGPIISVDGLPFIGPVFTRSHHSRVADLKPQADYIRQQYAHMSVQQMAAQIRQGLPIQATSEQSKKQILNMSRQSNPTFVGEAMYTLMTTDLRDEIANIKNPVLLLGAAGGYPDKNTKNAAAQLYQQQLSARSSAKLIMNNHARHFIMLDDPKWLIDNIRDFLRQAI